VHGSFDNHWTNWQFVRPSFETHFTVYAVARRGRGETTATEGHAVGDEGDDVVAVLNSIGEPAHLLGHSYGAHAALKAAINAPQLIRKLILYEPIWPHTFSSESLVPLEQLAAAGDWDAFCLAFFRDSLGIPQKDLDELRPTETWNQYLREAKASLGDVRALARYTFEPQAFETIDLPVLLQVGTESPRSLYVTDALAEVLPNCRIEELPGQAHEGMTTAPEMYARSVIRFLLD
jgi:pimeloyl-ACP methyl ester carboxylesterase